MHAIFGNMDPGVVSALLWALGAACSIIIAFCPAASVAYRLATVIGPMLSAASAPAERPVGSMVTVKSSSSALTAVGVRHDTTLRPAVISTTFQGPTVAQPPPPDDLVGGGG